jgi:hypothetical protein
MIHERWNCYNTDAGIATTRNLDMIFKQRWLREMDAIHLQLKVGIKTVQN